MIENQPEYLASLEALPDVERRRLLLGDWEAREANSTYFNRSWVEEIVEYPERSEIVQVVRAYDFAGTLKSDANPSPDYTATVKMAKLKNGKYVILDAKRIRIRFGDWEEFIVSNSIEDEPGTVVCIPEDPGPAAKAATQLLSRNLAALGIATVKMRASMKKLDRFRPFSAMAENNGVQILRGCCSDLENKVENKNEFFYKELEGFTGERKRGESGHDD